MAAGVADHIPSVLLGFRGGGLMEGSAIESHRRDIAIVARKVSRWLLKKCFHCGLITPARMTVAAKVFSPGAVLPNGHPEWLQ